MARWFECTVTETLACTCAIICVSCGSDSQGPLRRTYSSPEEYLNDSALCGNSESAVECYPGANPPNIEGTWSGTVDVRRSSVPMIHANSSIPVTVRFFDQVGTKIKMDLSSEIDLTSSSAYGSFVTGDGGFFSAFLTATWGNPYCQGDATGVVSGKKVNNRLEVSIAVHIESASGKDCAGTDAGQFALGISDLQ